MHVFSNRPHEIYRAPQLAQIIVPNTLCHNLNRQFPQTHLRKYIQRHDSTEFVDSERVKKGFMFGTSSDGGRLYFDLNDNLSIWEYWLDDGSIGKVADTFDEILEYGKIIDFE